MKKTHVLIVGHGTIGREHYAQVLMDKLEHSQIHVVPGHKEINEEFVTEKMPWKRLRIHDNFECKPNFPEPKSKYHK